MGDAATKQSIICACAAKWRQNGTHSPIASNVNGAKSSNYLITMKDQKKKINFDADYNYYYLLYFVPTGVLFDMVGFACCPKTIWLFSFFLW